MKEKIIEYLGRADYKGMEIHELAHVFEQNTTHQFKEFVKIMVALEDVGKVKRGIGDRYFLPEKMGVFTGKVILNAKGFAFIDLGEDEEDVYVAKDHLNGALNNDIVQVQIKQKSNGASLEGEVVKILERGSSRVVGLVVNRNRKFLLSVDDPKFNQMITLVGDRKGAMEGHKVVAKIIDYDTPMLGEVVEILGHKNDPGVDILSIVARYDLSTEFNEEVIAELSTIGDEVSEADKQNRVDLRSELIVTIDGDDAKDLDDAISIKRLKNGNFLLGVHIADVSNYVKEGSAIDKEAVVRGTSVYLVDRVIPMLPHKLSNGICSLNPRVDRLAITCLMEVNQSGEVVEHQILPTVINSTERMTYKNVNAILDGDEKLTKKYQHVAPMFFLMEKLAIILRGKRDRKGAIDFDVPEAKVIVDRKGKPIDIVLRERGISEKIIEEFMLLANETIAEHFKWLDLPFIYRVHEHPKKKKLLNFARIASTLGYKIKGSLDHVYPNELSKLIEETKNTPEHGIISTLLLRCMQKARYDVNCLGHYGLADEFYTHFTSPIRRYPDLLVHRLIRTYVFNQDMSPNTIKHFSEVLGDLAESSSNREIDAVNCERDVMDMKKAEYMQCHIGEVYEGLIASVTGFGFFVELPNTVDGLVHISTLTEDYFHYDDQYMMLVGEITGKQYRMSDKVKVRVVGASKVDGQVDFEVVTSKVKKKRQVKTIELNQRHFKENPSPKKRKRNSRSHVFSSSRQRQKRKQR